eukprot:5792059-Amphidinium_carterae.1
MQTMGHFQLLGQVRSDHCKQQCETSHKRWKCGAHWQRGRSFATPNLPLSMLHSLPKSGSGLGGG